VNAYSRDEEREADERGMRLASIAGYSPCGMTRVGEAIKQDNPDASYSFLSTHPNTKDRIKAAQKLANDRGFGLCKKSLKHPR
jgi:predicted Zn-dependent protease